MITPPLVHFRPMGLDIASRTELESAHGRRARREHHMTTLFNNIAEKVRGEIVAEIASWESVLADALDLEELTDAREARREIRRLRADLVRLARAVEGGL